MWSPRQRLWLVLLRSPQEPARVGQQCCAQGVGASRQCEQGTLGAAAESEQGRLSSQGPPTIPNLDLGAHSQVGEEVLGLAAEVEVSKEATTIVVAERQKPQITPKPLCKRAGGRRGAGPGRQGGGEQGGDHHRGC